MVEGGELEGDQPVKGLGLLSPGQTWGGDPASSSVVVDNVEIIHPQWTQGVGSSPRITPKGVVGPGLLPECGVGGSREGNPGRR